MTSDEFREIHEVWVELKAIYAEIDELNGVARDEEPELFGSSPVQPATAR